MCGAKRISFGGRSISVAMVFADQSWDRKEGGGLVLLLRSLGLIYLDISPHVFRYILISGYIWRYIWIYSDTSGIAIWESLSQITLLRTWEHGGSEMQWFHTDDYCCCELCVKVSKMWSNWWLRLFETFGICQVSINRVIDFNIVSTAEDVKESDCKISIHLDCIRKSLGMKFLIPGRGLCTTLSFRFHFV